MYFNNMPVIPLPNDGTVTNVKDIIRRVILAMNHTLDPPIMISIQSKIQTPPTLYLKNFMTTLRFIGSSFYTTTHLILSILSHCLNKT